MGKITIYYKYVEIENPQQICTWQKKLCKQLNLKGRILIAHEGINGTVGGLDHNIEKYKELMLAHPLFAGIDFKDSEGDVDHFPRLRVVVRPEIVNLGLDTQKINARNGGIHLTPEQAHEFLKNKSDDTVILDTRNKFEWKIGQFKDALNAPIDYFRELPAFIDENLDTFKDKKVLMACTAGARCERASAYLKSKNVAAEVYQIQGGIHRYVEQFPDGFFRGKNYVFDGRITVKVNEDIVGRCDVCNAPYDEPTNCINAECNKQFLACLACLEKRHNTCSETCSELVRLKKVNIRKIPAKKQ
ncbi:MAG: putative rhodanese-related sulfurtransferase [Candidatus Dependentiae bacterium ADurb.Bin331]|nr:MAG: putative rhodanese-related sulfurtransferase [Candidatus Dependentiae bacterium ADurb.Bin331]